MKRTNIIEWFLIALFLAFFGRACFGWLKANAQSIHHDTFDIEYSSKLGIPTQVRWSVKRTDLGHTKREPSFRFKADRETPRPRITSALYTRSGYQRGHMCPAADRSASKATMRGTFVMSNVCPQVPELNTGAWKRTEIFERRIATTYGRCSVWAAPIFFPEDTTTIGRGRVAVPHAFMKVVFDSNPSRLYGIFICENR